MNLASIQGVFAHVPLDWVFLGLLAALISLEALRGGATRAISFSLAAPVALLLYTLASNAVILGPVIKEFDSQKIQAGILLALFVVLFLLISRMTMVGFASGLFPVMAILCGIAAAIVGVIVWLQSPVLVSLWPFGAQVHLVFAAQYRFWWLVASYLALAFARS